MLPALCHSIDPSFCNGYSAPMAWAASSMIGIEYCLLRANNGCISAHCPYRWTGIIALIGFELPTAFCRASAAKFGSILKLSFSISTKTGVAPVRRMVPIVAKKVYALTKSRSPTPTSSDISAANRASVPLETPTPNEEPVYSATSFSKRSTIGPKIYPVESITLVTASRISDRSTSS